MTVAPGFKSILLMECSPVKRSDSPNSIEAAIIGATKMDC